LARKLGQIVARSDRRWLVRVYLGRDHQSRRRKYHNRTIRGGLRAAQGYLNNRLRERDLGREIEGAQITCNEYFDRWLQMAAKPKLRSKSYRDYEALLGRYIRPKLGGRMLPALTPLDIQGLYHGMHERGLSGRTIRYAHAVLHSALEQAVKWRLLLQNPSAGVELPKQARSEMRVMTPEEVRRFLQQALATRYGVVFAVAVTTGMRPSEYLALRWADINWNCGTVTVARTLEKGSGGWRFADTKRARSRRVIKLQNWVTGLLSRSHDLQLVRNTLSTAAAGQMFKTNSGQPINSDYLARQFKQILHQAGLPRMRLYDLRHTAATLALIAGVPAEVLSEQLGHASAAFTLDVYAHVLPHMQEEAATRVETLLYPTARGALRSIKTGQRKPVRPARFGNTKVEQKRRNTLKAG
jgi:integrase